MKMILLQFCSILLAFSLTACGIGKTQEPATTSSVTPLLPIVQGAEETSDEPTSELTVQLITEQGEPILFALNTSNAAKSLYEQLPLSLKIENYSDNEKIFYPPEKLDISNTPMAKGPTGTLAYYEPWGDVVIYYGNCEGASGLYQLGQVVSGAEHLSSMSGVIQVTAANSNTPLPKPAPPETVPASKESSATLESPSPEKETLPPAVSSSPLQSVAPPKQENSTTPPPAQAKIEPTPIPPQNIPEVESLKEETIRNMQLTIGNKTFTATLAENAGSRAFIELMQNAPVVINMNDYSGFEKVGSLGTSLPTDNSSITANEGDIILYNGNQIVVFYGSNSWSYTRLGKIDDLSGWKEALGNGDITITFSIK